MARRFKLACMLVSVWAGPVAAQMVRVEPSVGATLTYSDNTRLNRDRQTDWVLELTPRISMNARGARLVGQLDYAFNGVAHSASGIGTRRYNTLNANGTLEAIEGFLFVDARASMAGENLSAFAPAAADNLSASDNRRQVRSYAVSPYVRGQLKGLADYSVRLDWNMLDANAGSFARTSNERLTALLSSPQSLSRASWQVSANSSVNHYRDREDLRNDLLRARVGYSPVPQATVFATFGREGYNYVAGESSRTTRGAGFNLSLGPRTSVSAERESRFFGGYYAVKVAHRMPRTAFSIDLSRDLTSSTQQVFAAGNGNVLGTLFDLYATRIPDPLTRLTAIVDFLNKSGLPPFLARPFAFFAEQPFVDRRLQGTAVWTGARNNVAFSAYRSQREAQAIGFSLIDDFAFGRRIDSRGAAMEWSHNLTPLTTLNLSLSQSRNRALDGPASARNQRLALSLQAPLGVRSQGFMSLRHNRGDGLSEYRENALMAGLRMAF